MVGLSHLAGSGLLLVLALLPLTLDGKPALPPQALHKAPVAPTAPAAPTAPLRIMRDLRPDSKQSRADWDRMVQPEPHAGGARDSSRLQQQDNKGGTNGCFGRRLDRISHTTDMGCRRLTAAPKLPSALQNMQDLHAGKKQSQAA